MLTNLLVPRLLVDIHLTNNHLADTSTLATLGFDYINLHP
jgi:hypothetical protein